MVRRPTRSTHRRGIAESHTRISIPDGYHQNFPSTTRGSILTLARSNLLSPPVLSFGLGMFGTRVRSDLKLPSPLPTLLSTYLLLAIGLKGGAAMAKADAGDLALPAIATIAIGCMIPAVTFFVLRRIARMPINASAAMAAFTGSSQSGGVAAMIGEWPSPMIRSRCWSC